MGMRKRSIVIGILVMFLIGIIGVNVSYAGQKGGFHCGKGKGRQDGLKLKLLSQVHRAITNQEELGLSDEQVKKLKDLKITTKKDLVKKQGDIDIVAIDIKAELGEDTIDLAGIDKLIDQKYDLKKSKTKALVKAYADFKKVLTAEQSKKFKTLCYKSQR